MPKYRRYANSDIDPVRRIFQWAVAEELVGPPCIARDS